MLQAMNNIKNKTPAWCEEQKQDKAEMFQIQKQIKQPPAPRSLLSASTTSSLFVVSIKKRVIVN